MFCKNDPAERDLELGSRAVAGGVKRFLIQSHIWISLVVLAITRRVVFIVEAKFEPYIDKIAEFGDNGRNFGRDALFGLSVALNHAVLPCCIGFVLSY